MFEPESSMTPKTTLFKFCSLNILSFHLRSLEFLLRPCTVRILKLKEPETFEGTKKDLLKPEEIR